MTLILNFLTLQFSKPYRYFLLVSVNGVAKRTKISEISESPTFDSMEVEAGDIEVSVCLVLDYSQKGLEGKTVVLGKATIYEDEYKKSLGREGGVEVEKRFLQSREKSEIVVGIVRVKIMDCMGVKKESSSYFEDVQEIEMKEEEHVRNVVNYSEQGRRVKVGVLHGMHFPMHSSYRVEVGHASSYNQLSLKRGISTQLADHSINPLWNFHQSFSLENLEGGFLTFIIKSNKQTVIDKISFPIAKLIPFYQYHFEVTLKQPLQNAYPHILLSFQLEALPLAFTEEVCELHVNRVMITPQPLPSRKFVLLLSEQQLSQIDFQPITLDKDRPNEISGLQSLNKSHNIPYFISPIFSTPIPGQFNFEYFFLKSIFIRKRLSCTLFEFQKNTNTLKLVHKLSTNNSCLQHFKSCFYNEQPEKFSLEWKESGKNLRCTLEVIPSKVNLYLDGEQEFNKKKTQGVNEQWRDLSNELLLKQKLIHQMRQDIDQKILNIESKGKQIQVLRKVQHNLLERKKYLGYKQTKERMIQVGDYEMEGKINLEKLKRELLSLCEQTSAVESINNEMRLRLDALDLEEKEMNIKELEMRAVANSRTLLDQQEKVQTIERLDDLIKIQHRTLLRLEKQFQKGIIDHEMNELLNKELKKVEEDKTVIETAFARTNEEDNLNKILSLLRDKKQHKKPEGHIEHLKHQIQQAEEELRGKTLIYAKMINR